MVVNLIGASARHNNANQRIYKNIKCTNLNQGDGAMCSHKMHNVCRIKLNRKKVIFYIAGFKSYSSICWLICEKFSRITILERLI